MTDRSETVSTIAGMGLVAASIPATVFLPLAAMSPYGPLEIVVGLVLMGTAVVVSVKGYPLAGLLISGAAIWVKHWFYVDWEWGFYTTAVSAFPFIFAYIGWLRRGNPAP